MVSIVICDENSNNLKLLSEFVLGGNLFNGEEVNVKTFSDVFNFIDYLQMHSDEVDIIVCDTSINGYSGIGIVKEVQLFNQDIQVIFVSSERERVFEAYHVMHQYFVLKPISKYRLKEAFDFAYYNLERKEKKYISICSKGKISKIDLSNIYYIESELRLLKIHTIRGITESYGKIEMLIPMLDNRFFHCHKSYVVNMSYVSCIEKKSFLFENGERINISNANYKEAKDIYAKFLTNKFIPLNDNGKIQAK